MGALVFNHYKPKDDHPDWNRVQDMAARQVDEILPLIHLDADDSLADKARDYRRTASSLATAGRNALINRKRFRTGNHALRPFYFIYTMLNKCNFRCTYCDDHQGNHYYDLEEKKLSPEDRVRVFEIMRTGTSAVMLCGGEPTIFPDLPRLTDVAWNMGFRPLLVNTNAFQLHVVLKKPEWRKWLRQIDIIVVSLDGLSVPRLQKLWGIKRVEQVFANLLTLRELRNHVNFKVTVNAVIGPETVDMASDVLDFANDLGDIWFVPVPLNYHGRDGNGPAVQESLLARDDYRQLAQRMLKRKDEGHLMVGSQKLLDMVVHAKPYHCLPTLRPHVNPDGLIAWPCRGPKNCDPHYENLLDYDTLDDCWEAANAAMSATNFHGQSPNQCGDNCAWMQNYTTGRYHDFLADPLHAGLVSEIKEFAFQSR